MGVANDRNGEHPEHPAKRRPITFGHSQANNAKEQQYPRPRVVSVSWQVI